MNKVTFLTFTSVFIIILSTTKAENSTELCEKLTPLTGFDVNKIEGTWFLISRHITMPIVIGNDKSCTAEFKVNADKTKLLFKELELQRVRIFNRTDVNVTYFESSHDDTRSDIASVTILYYQEDFFLFGTCQKSWYEGEAVSIYAKSPFFEPSKSLEEEALSYMTRWSPITSFCPAPKADTTTEINAHNAVKSEKTASLAILIVIYFIEYLFV